MRGKVHLRVVSMKICRITPAYAGKRRPLKGRGFRITGSPPPMRGKVVPSTPKRKTMRITPAYAGKRYSDGFRSSMLQDHPRLCGEKNTPRTTAVGIAGSPPPMRGKAVQSDHLVFRYRITPAYAGKRTQKKQKNFLGKDHPRLCGEKFPSPSPPTYAEGSPPPMRGKADHLQRNNANLRITPAYAGKSHSFSKFALFQRDHPRLCGEKCIAKAQMRHNLRITPAYAGKRNFFIFFIPP